MLVVVVLFAGNSGKVVVIVVTGYEDGGDKSSYSVHGWKIMMAIVVRG